MAGCAAVVCWPSRDPSRLEPDLSRTQVEADLALDALEGVVDRLRIAVETVTDRLVGMPVEIEGEDLALELREHAREAGDEALELLGRDHPLRRVLASRPREHLLERRLRVARASRRLGE